MIPHVLSWAMCMHFIEIQMHQDTVLLYFQTQMCNLSHRRPYLGQDTKLQIAPCGCSIGVHVNGRHS